MTKELQQGGDASSTSSGSPAAALRVSSLVGRGLIRLVKRNYDGAREVSCFRVCCLVPRRVFEFFVCRSLFFCSYRTVFFPLFVCCLWLVVCFFCVLFLYPRLYDTYFLYLHIFPCFYQFVYAW